MENYLSYNLNHRIRFELSDEGLKDLVKYYSKFPYDKIQAPPIETVLSWYKCEVEGFLEMQLHVAFDYFGGYKTMSFAKGSKIYFNKENLKED